jgi:hypothetical protein
MNLSAKRKLESTEESSSSRQRTDDGDKESGNPELEANDG